MSAFLRTLRLAAVAALVPLAAACSDDSSGPRQPALGSYRMNLAGDLASRHSGEAVFGVDGSEGNEYFGVVMGAEEDVANLIFLRSGTTRLGVGTHEVANTTDQAEDDEDAVEVILGFGSAASGTVGVFDGRSGTITVTRSTASELSGTFTITVAGLLQEEGEEVARPATVQVSGAFTAEGAGASARVRTSRVRLERLGR